MDKEGLNKLKELAKKAITDLKTKFSVSAEYFAATNPVVILELIAEIERLQARDSTQWKEIDWLAEKCAEACNRTRLQCAYGKNSRIAFDCERAFCEDATKEEWLEAARKAAENQ